MAEDYEGMGSEHECCTTCGRKHDPLAVCPDRGEFGAPTIGHGMRMVDIQQAPSMPAFVMRVTEKGISVDYGDSGFDTEATTVEAKVILTKILPGLISMFLTKNSKYARAQTGHDLGPKGIIPDINRKTSVLISRLWDGASAGSEEGTEQVIDDLIGHLLLMRAKMRAYKS